MLIQSLRWCAAVLVLLGASMCSAQQQSAPASAENRQSETQPDIQKEKEIEKKEQSQRLLGVMPMFSVTHQNALPMTPGEKFHLALKSGVDPFVWVAAGIQAGISQATDGFHDYGQGAQGYGKRYGAAMADATASNFFSNFIYPVMLREDPRYFRVGTGSVKHRIGLSLVQVVVGYKDNGKRAFSFSNVLGAFSTGGLSNFYYPPSDRGFGLTMSRTGISLMYGGLSNILSEFWPEIQNKLRPKHKKPATP